MSRQSVVGFVILLMVTIGASGQQAQVPADLGRLTRMGGAAPGKGESFRFVVMGDNSDEPIAGVWEQAVGEVNLLAPDFVMCVGDLIQGNNVDQVEVARQWDQWEAMTRKLSAPLLFCPGNHDVSKEGMLQTYVDHWGVEGRSYYSFDYRSCHFIVLDSNSALFVEGFADRQFAWLESDLAAAKEAQHVFVFYHHPLWSNKAHPEIWKRLAGMLDPARTTIFNGHWHSYEYNKPDGIDTYVMATSGGDTLLRGADMGEFHMVAQVSVIDGKPSVAIIPLGQTRPGEFLTTQMYEEREQLAPGTYEEVMALWVTPMVRGDGLRLVLAQNNPLQVPLSATYACRTAGCGGKPVQMEVPAGQTGRAEMEVAGLPTEPVTVHASYRWQGKQGQPMTLELDYHAHEFTNAPRAAITVDGDLSDWAGLTAKPLQILPLIGPAQDVSCSARVACDDTHLYAAIEVTDDSVCTEGPNQDRVDLFWHIPPQAAVPPQAASRGRVRVTACQPSELQTTWVPGLPAGQAAPKAQVASRRTPTGYVVEASISLADIGVKTPVQPGQAISWLVGVDDGDLVDGQVQPRQRLGRRSLKDIHLFKVSAVE